MEMKIKVGFMTVLLVISLYSVYVFASDHTESLDVVVTWQGYNYLGVYSGETKDGIPNGKGEFYGTRTNKDLEECAISYSGKWRKGKINGKGNLTDHAEGVIYVGKFSFNKLNGKFKEYNSSDSDLEGGYIEKWYDKDVPYSVCKWYDQDGNVVYYDMYFQGISLDTIRQEAQTVPYDALLYKSEDYYYQMVKLSCKVVDLSDGTEKTVKIKDDDNNIYILSYSMSYPDNPVNYMPLLEKGDSILVYGYCSGLCGYEKSVNKYPCIKAIYGVYENENRFDLNSGIFSYDDFLNYPYLLNGTEITLSGVMTGVQKVVNKTTYLIIKSDSYSKGKRQIYICYLDEKRAKKVQTPLPGEKVQFRVQLNLNSSYLDGEEVVFCPLAEIIAQEEVNE